MTNQRDLILKLKEVRIEKGYSYADIIRIMEENGDYISKSTLSRLFAEGSEEISFKYEETIRPVAKALLNIEEIDADDNMDVSAMKLLLRYKIQRIEDLEKQVEHLTAALDKEKVKSHEKLEKERKTYNDRIEFLLHQIELKDKRMDLLLEKVLNKE